MNDDEIRSQLEDAGYTFDVVSGQYLTEGQTEEEEGFNPEDISNELEIPLDDLIRWQKEQQHADEAL